MFAFGNGACGLAFSTRSTTPTGGQRGVYVSFLGGDYGLGWSPLGFVSKSEIAELHADAGERANVMVEKATGRATVRRGATHMMTVPATVFVNAPTCKYVAVPASISDRYEILRSSVSCVVVRMLLGAWSDEGSAEAARGMKSPMSIIGWRCVGSERKREFTPTTYEKVTCVRGSNIVEAHNELGRSFEHTAGSGSHRKASGPQPSTLSPNTAPASSA